MGFVRMLERRSKLVGFLQRPIKEERDGGGGFIMRDENAGAISCL